MIKENECYTVNTPPKNFKQGSDCPRSAFAQMNKFVIYVTLKV